VAGSISPCKVASHIDVGGPGEAMNAAPSCVVTAIELAISGIRDKKKSAVGYLPKMTIGLFLGAGASLELGMPLTWDLSVELLGWLTADKLRHFNRGWRSQGGGYPDEVIEDFISTIQTPGMHYESMLGYLQTQYRRSTKFAQEYHGLYAWLVEIVYFILYYRHLRNQSYVTAGLRYFEGIAGLARESHPLWVFSSNHDLMAECICTQCGLTICTGFTETVSLPRLDGAGKRIGELKAKVLPGEELERYGITFAPPGEPVVNLFKVHGALDTFTFRDGRDLLKLDPLGPGVGGILDALKVANEELFYLAHGQRIKATNEITYTDENGEMQFLRRSLLAGAFKFDKRFTQVIPELLLDQFRHKLNFVTRLICIGYGFADVHINDAISRWLEFSAERCIEIVGPGVRAVPSFLLHLSRQVSLHDRRATEFLEQFADNPLNKSERFCKAVRDIAREFRRKQKGFA
jgi:hypothetical protein